MQIAVNIATGFIGMFQKGGTTFVGLVTGIIPLLIVLMTAVNALVRFIGPERVDKVAILSSRNVFLRYLVLPFLSVFFLTNPMAYTMGRFLPEKQKPAFYDSAVSFVHPILGLFPHANPGEYFVWAGIAAGITTLHLNIGDLAIRYFLVGLLVIFLRGLLTERITAVMWARRPAAETEETWAEQAETAAAEEVVEDSYPGPAIPSEENGARRVHRPATPGENAGIERTQTSTTTSGEEI
ncbi:MAG TPA: PTS glucitol/sorbitol transporter subunit IIC [Ktedonobacteraceae bacterium]|nr:PTS glucitol/sorbitol transporter subunit IIC [Ktedonobacteraceae bacterium]